MEEEIPSGIARLLTDTGDAGSSPHVANDIFSNDIP